MVWYGQCKEYMKLPISTLPFLVLFLSPLAADWRTQSRGYSTHRSTKVLATTARFIKLYCTNKKTINYFHLSDLACIYEKYRRRWGNFPSRSQNSLMDYLFEFKWSQPQRKPLVIFLSALYKNNPAVSGIYTQCHKTLHKKPSPCLHSLSNIW